MLGHQTAKIGKDISIVLYNKANFEHSTHCVSTMSLQVIQRAASSIMQSQTFRFSIINVPAVVHKWITANPGQTALLIRNGILIFTPAALTGPLLATMGWGVSGPVAGQCSRCGSWKYRD